MDILAALYENQDPAYRAFQCRLIPTVEPAAVIGVRTPQLRAVAKSLRGTQEAAAFLEGLPHHFYEENNLHALLVAEEKEFSRALALTEAFLPFVDNWATCDIFSPKAFRKHREKLLPVIERWLASDKTYTVRFGLGMLMQHYLDEAFRPAYLALAASVRSEEYYVNMMQAWFFATALTKQWEEALPFLAESRLPRWVHLKTIQKAVESYRIPEERKAHLRGLRNLASEMG